VSLLLQNGPEITALLIAPDRNLAQKFLDTIPQTRGFRFWRTLRVIRRIRLLKSGRAS
jgi:hypothetical protein